MRTLFITIIFAVWMNINSVGQSNITIFGFGLNSSFVKPDVFNHIIGRYNETRPYLTQTMDEISYMNGAAWSLQWINEIYFLDLTFARRKQSMFATATQNNELVQRDLKVRAHTINMGMGLNLSKSSPFLALGMDLDLGSLRVDSRYDLVSSIKEADYEKIFNGMLIGGSFFFQILAIHPNARWIGIALKPYYHFDFLSINLYDLNQSLNPNTYMNDEFEMYGHFNHFGLALSLSFIKAD